MILTTTTHFMKEINTYLAAAKSGETIQILCADESVLELKKVEEEGKNGKN